MLICGWELYLTPQTTYSKEEGLPAVAEASTAHLEIARVRESLWPIATWNTQKRHHKQVVSYTF
jgi:hypothetical protein